MGGPLNWTDAILPVGASVRAFNFAKDALAGPPDAPAPPAPPPTTPDLTDQTIQAARVAARRRLLMDQAPGFLTGPLGDITKPPTVGR